MSETILCRCGVRLAMEDAEGLPLMAGEPLPEPWREPTVAEIVAHAPIVELLCAERYRSGSGTGR